MSVPIKKATITERGEDVILDSAFTFAADKLFLPASALLKTAKVFLGGAGDWIGLFLESATQIYWSGSGSPVGTSDLGLKRSAAGKLQITDGSTGSGDLALKDITAINKMTMDSTGQGIVMPKTSGIGIMVDPSSPTYGWHDIIGDIRPKTAGAGSPSLNAFLGTNVSAYSFIVNDVCDFTFHIPHDYLPGSHLYFHIHWAHVGTAISGTFGMDVYMTYAKGHDQANFSAEVTSTISYATVDIATTPQYRHRIDEIQISATSPGAGQIDTDDIEPDGILIVRIKLTSEPTITGGTTNHPFILMGDLHYQSTGISTKNKAPNFYT